MKDWENEFMVNFRNLVRESKLPLSSISRATGIPNSTLDNWINERTAPRLDWRIVALAKFFKKPIDYFLRNPDSGKPVSIKKPKSYHCKQFDLFGEAK